jgi:hypothetical protein
MPEIQPGQRVPKKGFPRQPDSFPLAQQEAKFTPKFDRLREVLGRDPEGLSLRMDPSALAPERLLVFEVRGPISSFITAINNIVGLELIDEEELETDEDKSPTAYLLVPDLAALRSIESLWRTWCRNEPLGTGFTGWRDVFSLLRDLRLWGPQDRVEQQDADVLAEEIEWRGEDDRIRLEIELVYRKSSQLAAEAEQALIADILRRDGRIVSQSRIEDIAYHALLVDLPVAAVRAIISREQTGIAGIDAVMHIRPQSIATTLEIAEPERDESPIEIGELGEPILALIDGVPVARHRLLERHLIVDDQFGLEPATVVADRKHGTAMASLIVHGDRNLLQAPLPRKIHVVPVLTAEPGADESFPADRLIVDVIYMAVRAIRGDTLTAGAPAPTAPGVLIVNLSLGNPRQSFHGRLSAWAKLLDRLAYEYGILFVISAGNVGKRFSVPAFSTRTAFEDSDVDARAAGVLSAVGALMGERRIIAPADSVNGVTVGACNDDAVPLRERQTASVMIDPYAQTRMSNPSSALGPGYARAVKPDILMPGARERLHVLNNAASIEVEPAGPSRAAGLKVAAPPRTGQEDFESYTNGTSAAAALASRTCHRIHDALEEAYGRQFLLLSHRNRAVLLKALLAHTAQWPTDTAALIKKILGPANNRQHSRQKDNIRRFLGYGIVDADAAIACADDRATFWSVGEILENQVIHVPIPVPAAIGGKAKPHAITVTLAWFTPTRPGTQAYRSVRLRLLKPNELNTLRLEQSNSCQPDINQSNCGTLFSQRWEGDKAPVVSPDMTIPIHIQREVDRGGLKIDEPIPFGLAVTITMPGVVEIYEQVRQRLGLQTRTPLR